MSDWVCEVCRGSGRRPLVTGAGVLWSDCATCGGTGDVQAKEMEDAGKRRCKVTGKVPKDDEAERNAPCGRCGVRPCDCSDQVDMDGRSW